MNQAGKAGVVMMIKLPHPCYRLVANKEKYNVGDEVALTIPSSKGGRVLVSVENGSKVIKSFLAGNKAGTNHCYI